MMESGAPFFGDLMDRIKLIKRLNICSVGEKRARLILEYRALCRGVFDI